MASSSGSTPNGREEALALAQQLRAARESVTERIRSGDIDVREVLGSEDPLVGRVKVVSVVENVPGLGKVKARRILDEVGVSAALKIHQLDGATRRALLDHLTT